jgi:hypothetical protein
MLQSELHVEEQLDGSFLGAILGAIARNATELLWKTAPE